MVAYVRMCVCVCVCVCVYGCWGSVYACVYVYGHVCVLDRSCMVVPYIQGIVDWPWIVDEDIKILSEHKYKDSYIIYVYSCDVGL